jgi:hypothetical protein
MDECTKGLLNENKTRRVYILNEMSTSGMAQANGFRLMEFVRGFERLQRSVVSCDCPGGRKAGVHYYSSTVCNSLGSDSTLVYTVPVGSVVYTMQREQSIALACYPNANKTRWDPTW